MYFQTNENHLMVSSDLQTAIGEARLHGSRSVGAISFNFGNRRSTVQNWLNQVWRKLHPQGVSFGVLCLFIAVVSVHDAAMVVVNHQVIGEVEQNPIGQWLLEQNGGHVWLFVFVKLAATAFVCTVLIFSYQFHQKLAMRLARGLAAFQMTLLGYLTAF